MTTSYCGDDGYGNEFDSDMDMDVVRCFQKYFCN